MYIGADPLHSETNINGDDTTVAMLVFRDADEAGEVHKSLWRLQSLVLEVNKGEVWRAAPVLESATAKEANVSITFTPGVLEILSKELKDRELRIPYRLTK